MQANSYFAKAEIWIIDIRKGHTMVYIGFFPSQTIFAGITRAPWRVTLMSIWTTTARFHLYGEPYSIAFKTNNLYRKYMVKKRLFIRGKAFLSCYMKIKLFQGHNINHSQAKELLVKQLKNAVPFRPYRTKISTSWRPNEIILFQHLNSTFKTNKL
jgi:hypothetical protein